MPTTYHDFVQKHVDAFHSKNGWGEDSPTWAKFCAAESDSQRFQMALSHLPNYVVKVEDDPNGKNAAKSLEARNCGNAHFVKKDFGQALLSYNQAIIHAPWPLKGGKNGKDEGPDESLALAYANRSAVFYNIGRYAECVADVDRAVLSGYPASKLKKLLVRKVRALIQAGCFEDAFKCLDQELSSIGESESDPEYKELLDQASKGFDEQRQKKQTVSGLELLRLAGPDMAKKAAKWQLKNGCHDIFPAVSSVLELSHDEDGGPRFVAVEDVSPGDVLAVEGSFVNSLFWHNFGSHCQNCTMWTDMPVPCQGCTKTVFCSVECSKSERAQLHRKECPFLWMLECPSDMMSWEVQARTVSVMRALLGKTPQEWAKLAENYPPQAPKSGIHHTKDYYSFLHLDDNSLKDCSFLPLLGGAFSSVYIMKLLEKAPGFGDELAAEDPSVKEFLGGLALRLFVHLSTSKGDFSSEYLSPVDVLEDAYRQTGVALRPTLALFGKRGCHPNVAEACFGDTLVIRASYPIKKGEPVLRMFGSYFFFEYAKPARQTAIKESLSYDCTCRACQEDWPRVREDAGERIRFRCLKCSHPFTMHVSFDFPAADDPGQRLCPKCGWNGLASLMKHEEFWGRLNPCHYPSSLMFKIMADVARFLEPRDDMLNSFALKLMTSWGVEGNKSFMRELIQVETEYV